jgi:hypothetical protein
MSSGTEGLLWRILDELHIDDSVHVHLAGNLNRDHPLVQGLQFIYVPILRAGTGDPRLVPDHYSLKEIIKDCEAVVVAGTGHTHESLIRAVAEQMGSAHEDEGVAPHLIELSGTVLSDRGTLHSLIASDAEFVLEVGERAISKLVANGDFVKPHRPPISLPIQSSSPLLSERGVDFEAAPAAVPPEGTYMFLIDHRHLDWRANAQGYNFGPYVQGGLMVRVAKNPDQTIEVWVNGLGSGIAGIISRIPSTDQPGVMVGFTWTTSEIVFYLCGQRVATALPF